MVDLPMVTYQFPWLWIWGEAAFGRVASQSATSKKRVFVSPYLGGTTCLTLLVWYGRICFLRQYLSNAANWTCHMFHHFWQEMC